MPVCGMLVGVRLAWCPCVVLLVEGRVSLWLCCLVGLIV
uniref:Uncharacterized protein n=1 Tax=Phage sp. ctesc4 TaxID=2828008 RepID=A0A8S5TD51_9VIRU|nr:MAG TPA: hypothetical protein [Phage sp. ctesc4]